MESSQASDYLEKLQLNASENFPGELQITLQLGSRWAFAASYQLAIKKQVLLIINQSLRPCTPRNSNHDGPFLCLSGPLVPILPMSGHRDPWGIRVYNAYYELLHCQWWECRAIHLSAQGSKYFLVTGAILDKSYQK